MIERISESLANLMIDNQIISEEDYAWKKYGIQLFLVQLSCFLFSILLCFLLSRLKECILLLFFLMPLRSCIGGVHASKFSTCFILSNLIVVFGSETIYYCVHFLSESLFFLLLVMGISTSLFLWFENASIVHLPKAEKNRDKIIHRKKILLIVNLVIGIISISTNADNFYTSIICSQFVSTCTVLAQTILSKISRLPENHVS